MRGTIEIAVLSDVHSNHIALEECLHEIQRRGITTLIFLGDYLGELAYPRKTMELLYSLRDTYNCFFIRGNKEDYWIEYKNEGQEGWEEVSSSTGSLFYTYSHMLSEDIKFFEEMPIAMEVGIEGFPKLTICHGTPEKNGAKMLPNDEATIRYIVENENDYILCGHTHVQTCIPYKNKVVLNPGAVGVSQGSDGKAQFMVLHGEAEGWKHEFISLHYDVDAAIQELNECGLKKMALAWTKITEHLLRTGKISHGQVLNCAYKLCAEAEGSCDWLRIPEQYWEEALKVLGVEELK